MAFTAGGLFSVCRLPHTMLKLTKWEIDRPMVNTYLILHYWCLNEQRVCVTMTKRCACCGGGLTPAGEEVKVFPEDCN